jgi:hypothetical protein
MHIIPLGCIRKERYLQTKKLISKGNLENKNGEVQVEDLSCLNHDI